MSKVREGGHIRRVYDKPRTPYQRLMESGQISRKTRQQLRSIYEGLNPAELKRSIDEKREQLEAASASKTEVIRKPAHRGPDLTISKRRGSVAAD